MAKEMITCPVCGSENRPGSEKCRECGNMLPVSDPSVSEAGRTVKKKKTRKQRIADFFALIFIILVILGALAIRMDWFVSDLTVKEQNRKAYEKRFEDTVVIGSWEQNNRAKSTEDIEWIVLEREDGRALVISKYVLECLRFGSVSDEYVTWENSEVRTWLNEDFLENAFTEEEKERILVSEVTADENPQYDVDAGNAVEDRIFLLSAAEAERYFADDEMRACMPTKYMNAKYELPDPNGYCSWWLRTPGCGGMSVCCVDQDGRVNCFGAIRSLTQTGVRPAMWIEL